MDYWKLNEATLKDSYPLPRIDYTLDALGGSHWFSTLDLKSGYWQVAMDPADKEKTAFTIGGGLWHNMTELYDVLMFFTMFSCSFNMTELYDVLM